jgi:hypothetical protein
MNKKCIFLAWRKDKAKKIFIRENNFDSFNIVLFTFLELPSISLLLCLVLHRNMLFHYLTLLNCSVDNAAKHCAGWLLHKHHIIAWNAWRQVWGQ